MKNKHDILPRFFVVYNFLLMLWVAFWIFCVIHSDTDLRFITIHTARGLAAEIWLLNNIILCITKHKLVRILCIIFNIIALGHAVYYTILAATIPDWSIWRILDILFFLATAVFAFIILKYQKSASHTDNQ